MFIKGYIDNSNITIINAIYMRPHKMDNGKYTKGTMCIIYRDLNTGKKYLEEIEDPDYTFYMTKEGIIPAKKALFIEKDKVNPITVKYRNIDREIAKLTGNEDFYRENLYSGNRGANRHLHSDCVNVFKSDVNIEDYYRALFDNTYKNTPYEPTKAYFDIETDNIDISGVPEPGECPVNALTYIDVEHKYIYTLLLRNIENPQIPEFEDYMNNGNGYNDLKEFIKSRVGGDKGIDKYKMIDFRYKMIFYDEEIKLIADFFKVVNISKPDFVMAWNARFDIPYLEARIRVLGYDPLEIMCHKDFSEKYYMYYIDQNRTKPIPKRGDYCVMSSYSVWYDQMILFAARRSAKAGAYKNWKLDYIGTATTGIGKLDYSHITRKISELPYKDYKTFVFYNVMDTIVQYCIESKVNDIGYFFNKALMNNTRYNKTHNQTIYLVNRAAKVFDSKDLVIGNNKNIFNQEPTDKYPGAHVASPKKINPYSKYKINNLPIMVFNNLDDFDYTSMYPSILNEFNIAPNTQVGRIEIPNQIQENEDPYKLEHFSRSTKFIEDLHSHNYIEFCHRWFNLASYKDLCKDIDYYFRHIKQSQYVNYKAYNGHIRPICYRNDNRQRYIQYVRPKQYIQRNYSIPKECIEARDSIDINQIVYREDFQI